MNAPAEDPQRVLEAYLDASVLLETIIPGAVVDDLDGLRHIHYGRPKAGVQHELIVVDDIPANIRAVVAAHPEVLPAYLSTFTPLDRDVSNLAVDSGPRRVVRTTLMTCQLPDVVPFADPTLKRLTDPGELRSLALVRGDNVLDVDYYMDSIRCYVLEIEDEPVSSALLIPSIHDTAVIEHVQTLAAYRRRGYGRWLLRALHAEAARMGMEQIVLGSNDAGQPLYTALGYQPLWYQDVYLIES